MNNNEPIILGKVKKSGASKPILVIIIFLIVGSIILFIPTIANYFGDYNIVDLIKNGEIVNFFVNHDSYIKKSIVEDDNKKEETKVNYINAKTTIKYNGFYLNNFNINNTSISFNVNKENIDLDNYGYYLILKQNNKELEIIKITNDNNIIFTFNNELTSLVNIEGIIKEYKENDYPDYKLSSDESGLASMFCTKENDEYEFIFDNNKLTTIKENYNYIDNGNNTTYLKEYDKYNKISNELNDSGIESTITEDINGFKFTSNVNLKEYDINKLDKKFRSNVLKSETNGLELIIGDSTKIEVLYEFIKNMKDRDVNYYRNIYNTFKRNELADLLLVKVNYETYLINAKKRVEEEQIRNEELNERLRNDTNERNLNEKMNSDKALEQYKQDVIYATEGMKKNEETYIAGAITIKYNNKVSIFIAGVDKNYNYLNPNYFLHHKILEMYKNDFDICDINGIADDFESDSKFKGLNRFKIGFNPEIVEYIGELDLVVNNWGFKRLEKNNLLSNEFTKKKDV